MTTMMNIITLTKISMLETPSDSQKLVLEIGIGPVRVISYQMARPYIIVTLSTFELMYTATGVLNICL